jgi:hypothetical protein
VGGTANAAYFVCLILLVGTEQRKGNSWEGKDSQTLSLERGLLDSSLISEISQQSILPLAILSQKILP